MSEQNEQSVSTTDHMEALKACGLTHLLAAKASDYFHFPEEYPQIFRFEQMFSSKNRIYGYHGDNIILFETTETTTTESPFEGTTREEDEVVNKDSALMMVSNLKVLGVINKFDMTTKSSTEITTLIENPEKDENSSLRWRRYIHNNMTIECGNTYNEIFVCTKSLRVAFYGCEYDPHLHTKFEHIEFDFPHNYTGIREIYDVYHGSIYKVYLSTKGNPDGLIKFGYFAGKVHEIYIFVQPQSETLQETTDCDASSEQKIEKVQETTDCDASSEQEKISGRLKLRKLASGIAGLVYNLFHKDNNKNNEVIQETPKEMVDLDAQKPKEMVDLDAQKSLEKVNESRTIISTFTFNQLDIDIPLENYRMRTLKFHFGMFNSFNLYFVDGSLCNIHGQLLSMLYSGFGINIDLRNGCHTKTFCHDGGIIFAGTASYEYEIERFSRKNYMEKHLIQFEFALTQQAFKLKCSAIKDNTYANLFDKPVTIEGNTYGPTDDIPVNSLLGYIVGNLNIDVPYDISATKLTDRMQIY